MWLTIDNSLKDGLHQESKGVSIGLGFLDQSSSQVVCASPLAELTNVLTVQRDGFSPNFVELISSQNNLSTVDSGRENSELGHLSHLKAGYTAASRARGCSGSSWSLRNHEIRSSSGRNGEGADGRNGKGKKNDECLVGLHGYSLRCKVNVITLRSRFGSSRVVALRTRDR